MSVVNEERQLHEAAEAGDIEAMGNLGCLLRDRGQTQEAESWIRKAAEAGDSDAADSLGMLLQGKYSEVL